MKNPPKLALGYGAVDHPAIEMLSPVRLKTYPRNARTHSKKQIRQIAASIERFGFTNPVLIDEADRSSPATAVSKPPSSSAWPKWPASGSSG